MAEFPIYSHIRYDAVPNEDGNLRLAFTDVSTNDWVEVVRCKDCVHLDPDTGDCRNPFGIERPRPDNFCCNGRRRSNSDG